MNTEYKNKSQKEIENIVISKFSSIFPSFYPVSLASPLDFISDSKFKAIRPFLNSDKDFIELPKEKVDRVRFIYLLAHSKRIFTKKGMQLSTVFIGNRLNVSPMTIHNWIKKLISLGFIEVSKSTYSVGKKAIEYRIVKTDKNLDFCNFLNEFNGFKKKHKYTDKLQELYRQRLVGFQNFDPSSQEYPSCIGLFHNRADVFIRETTNRIQTKILKEPSKNNVNQTRFSQMITMWNYIQSMAKTKAKNLVIEAIKLKNQFLLVAKQKQSAFIEENYLKKVEISESLLLPNENDKANTKQKALNLMYEFRSTKDTQERFKILYHLASLKYAISTELKLDLLSKKELPNISKQSNFLITVINEKPGTNDQYYQKEPVSVIRAPKSYLERTLNSLSQYVSKKQYQKLTNLVDSYQPFQLSF